LEVHNRAGSVVDLLIDSSNDEFAWTCRYKSDVTVLSDAFKTALQKPSENQSDQDRSLNLRKNENPIFW